MFDLFKSYCPSAPKIETNLKHPKTGKIYETKKFSTYALPCFNELYNKFYHLRVKIIPSNIEELITPVSLGYWIADDGSWNKVNKYLTLCTDSFNLNEVELLIKVLNKKYSLNTYKVKNGLNYRIIIPAYSILLLQELVSNHIPPMFKYKIGL